jgi:L-asparagine transporter-like permease
VDRPEYDRRIQEEQKETKMDARREGTIAILAALLVLLSAMWDPRVSVIVSVAALVALGIYKLVPRRK